MQRRMGPYLIILVAVSQLISKSLKLNGRLFFSLQCTVISISRYSAAASTWLTVHFVGWKKKVIVEQEETCIS